MDKPSVPDVIENMKRFDIAPITNEDNIVYVELGEKPVKSLLYKDVIMFLDQFEGISPDVRTHLPNIKKMELDSDDVIICAFPKSGTHWLWEITNMLKTGNAEYSDQSKVNAMMEFVPAENLRAITKPRVFNTHFTFPNLPQAVTDKKCKVVFIERNPKDVLVSFLPFLKGFFFIEAHVTWGEFFDKYMEFDIDSALLNLFYYTRSWHAVLKENRENIHRLSFEDLKEDPVREISKLARFLEVEENMELFNDIADKCDFKNLKKAAESKLSLYQIRHDHQFIYRKGEVGDWKNHFTVAQNERFDAVYNEKMKGVDVKYRYTL